MASNRGRTASLAVAAALAVLSVWLQTGAALNMDAGYYLKVAPQLVSGEFHFGADAPIYTSLYRMMNFLLYVIPGAGAAALGISDEIALKLFVYALAALDAVYLWMFCRRSEERFGAGVWMLLPAFVFFGLVWPVESFGQREHFFILLADPFILFAARRALDLQGPPSRLPLAGVLCGLGIAIKPQFTLTWLLQEAYAAFTRRSLKVLWTPTTAAVVLVAAAYYVFVVLYVFHVGLDRLAEGFYFYRAYFSPTWELVLFRKLSLLWIAVAALYALLLFARLRNRGCDVFFLAFAAGFLQVVLLKLWIDYHWLPAAFFAGQFVVWTLATAGPVALRGARRWYAAGLAGLVGLALLLAVARPIVWGPVAFGMRDRAVAMGRLIESRAHGRPIAYFGFSYWPFFPAINYAGSPLGSRFSSMFYLPGLEAALSEGKPKQLTFSPLLRPFFKGTHVGAPDNGQRLLASLLAAVKSDLEKWQPAVIVISDETLPLRDRILASPELAPVMAKYRLFATLGGQKLLERLPPAEMPKDGK